MRKKIVFIILIVMVVWGCNSSFKEDKNISIDHIFLVTLDTLRADHLSCYGYARKIAPFIDSMAEEGILFKNAFSASATTAPAHATIFTSYYPLTHRVNKNWYKLNDNYVTMAEILKKNGFVTAAITSISLFKACNLYQGFDYFDEPPLKKNAITMWEKKYRESALTYRAIKEYFNPKGPGHQKLFVWIHLFDPHRPYYPPGKYKKRIELLKDKERILNFWKNSHKINPVLYKGEVFKKRERSEFFKENPDYYENWNAEDIMFDQINLYDAEIMYVDETLKKIYNYFDKKGLNKNSLWIVTGDHGEGLGNHNWFNHSKKVNVEAIKIPLIIKCSHGKKGKIIAQIVEHSDILPTITDLLGIALADYVKKPTGVSLKKYITGSGKPYKKLYSFSQREYFKPRKNLKKVPAYMMYEHGETYSLQSNEFQYIFRTKGESEFFNIKKNPYAAVSLDGNAKTKGLYLYKIKELIRKSENLAVTVKKSSKREIEKIKSFGYLE